VIKRPKLTFEKDRDYDKFLRRFKREGQVLAQVQIPNIVRVIEFTEIDGMPCLVMDFVAGETLNECIRRRGYIPEDEAVKLFQKLASAVEALHQQGIIHCDIHPGNIIVQPNSEPMLIDFGSTKLLHPTTWTVTTTVNKDFGPYDQMAESTENNLGSQPAWDIYSLAANMFFAMTGQKPMSAISRKLYGDSLKAPKELKYDLSDRLNRVILKGMALEAKDRPSSVKMWISLLDVSAQSNPQNKPKNQESRFGSPTLQRQDKSYISSLFTKKKSRAFRHGIAIFFLILGYFLQGIILGNHYSVNWGWTLIGALIGSLSWAIGRDVSTNTGAWFGALMGSWFGALALLLAGARCWSFAMAFAGGFTLFSAIVWAGLKSNDGRADPPYVWFLMITLYGSLSGGGFSGYLTNIGIIGGVWYGLFSWGIFITMFLGYAISEGRLERKYGEMQASCIYCTFSSIGLMLGGMLGSWLKVAGIIKLP
jgi:Protein kinase domain